MKIRFVLRGLTGIVCKGAKMCYRALRLQRGLCSELMSGFRQDCNQHRRWEQAPPPPKNGQILSLPVLDVFDASLSAVLRLFHILLKCCYMSHFWKWKTSHLIIYSENHKLTWPEFTHIWCFFYSFKLSFFLVLLGFVTSYVVKLIFIVLY